MTRKTYIATPGKRQDIVIQVDASHRTTARYAYWAWIAWRDGQRLGQAVGRVKTANPHEAELASIRKAIEWVGAAWPDVSVLIRCDNRALVQQLNGQARCRREPLRESVQALRAAAAGHDWLFEWIPRTANHRADTLAVMARGAAQAVRRP